MQNRLKQLGEVMKKLKASISIALTSLLLASCTSSTDFGFGITGNALPRFAFWDGVLLEPEDQAFAVICQHARAFETGKLIVEGQLEKPSKSELNENFRDVSIAGLGLLSIQFPEMESYREGAVAKLSDPGRNTDQWNRFESACESYNKLIDRTFFVTTGITALVFPGCFDAEYQFGVQADLRVQKGDEWVSVADGEFVEDELCKNDIYSDGRTMRLRARIPEYSEENKIRWYMSTVGGGEFSEGGSQRVYELSVGRNVIGDIREIEP
jgi:hypothetical protein